MRTNTIALILAVSAGAAFAADEVVLSSGLPYSGSQIVSVTDGQLVFKTGGGRELRKAMAEIRSITLGREIAFNEAESLLVRGDGLLRRKQAPQARTAYEAAARKFESLTGPRESVRVKALVPWRAMFAWDKAGRIDKALIIWLGLLEQGASANVLNAQPATVGAKGSTANAKAIALLGPRLAAGKDSATIAAAIKSALVTLYTAEGRLDDVTKFGGSGVAIKPANQGDIPAQRLSVGSASQQIKLAALQLEQNRAGDALKLVTGNLPRFRERELADALWIAGQARMKLSASATPEKGRELWIQAGLDFMRIYVYWPQSPHAPAALFGAARVNALLGNPGAARMACQRIVAEYDGTPWAEKAGAELKKKTAGS